MKIRATARVQVTVEVDADAWGEDCSIGQLYKQAAESGVTKLHNMLKEQPYRIIGSPKVIGVITESV